MNEPLSNNEKDIRKIKIIKILMNPFTIIEDIMKELIIYLYCLRGEREVWAPGHVLKTVKKSKKNSFLMAFSSFMDHSLDSTSILSCLNQLFYGFLLCQTHQNLLIIFFIITGFSSSQDLSASVFYLLISSILREDCMILYL